MQRILAILSLLLVGLIGISLTTDVRAGDKKKDSGGIPKVERGPEHKVLESWTGVFDATVKVYFPDPTKPSASKGVMTRTMILGGNFLQESYQGEFFGAPFSGMGVIGFNNVKKKFTTTWFDSTSTSMMLMEGTYDEKTKTLTMVGDDYEPNTKKKMKARDVLKITGADTQTFEMFRLPDGETKEFKIMEIAYTRKKVKQ